MFCFRLYWNHEEVNFHFYRNRHISTGFCVFGFKLKLKYIESNRKDRIFDWGFRFLCNTMCETIWSYWDSVWVVERRSIDFRLLTINCPQSNCFINVFPMIAVIAVISNKSILCVLPRWIPPFQGQGWVFLRIFLVDLYTQITNQCFFRCVMQFCVCVLLFSFVWESIRQLGRMETVTNESFNRK